MSLLLIHTNFTIILEADSGMLRRDFRDLLVNTARAAVQTFEFTEDVLMISSLLGEVVGKTFPTEFCHVPF